MARMNLLPSGLAILIALISVTPALAQETVSIGASRAILLRPANAQGSVILMPGGDGLIGAGSNGTISRLKRNQLVRTRTAYLQRGLAVLVVDAEVDLTLAVKYMADIRKPVTVIATSRGTLRAAKGLARGAAPDALVLTSGFLTSGSGSGENVESILGSPKLLPHTLVIHHRQDGCGKTRPAGVAPFIRWAAGRAEVTWLSGGHNQGDPCQAMAFHGFNGLDDQVVALAAAFH